MTAAAANGVQLVADVHAELGEGPVWDVSRRQLIWVDMTAGLLHFYNPDVRSDRAVSLGRMLGSVQLAGDGTLVIAAEGGLFRFAEPAGLAPLLPLADSPGTFLNDSRCDPAGRLWVGATTKAEVDGAGCLYRVEPNLTASTALTGLTIPNGLDWSPDGSTMYFADSPTRRIDSFAFDPASGQLGQQRTLARLGSGQGIPDGLTVDAEGAIWAACWGGWSVSRFTPDGRTDLVVDVPVEHVTSCAFGGPSLRDLYITTASDPGDGTPRRAHRGAGGLFCYHAPVAGRPVRRFRPHHRDRHQ